MCLFFTCGICGICGKGANCLSLRILPFHNSTTRVLRHFFMTICFVC